MSFEEVTVPTPDVFDSTIQTQLTNNPGALLFVYVTGKKDEHGKSWCPDCVESVC